MGIRPEQVEEAAALQRAAASDESGTVRVVAGPGTGKSFTIEERVSWLLSEGASAESIAAVSFTRAAAFDLHGRVRNACIEAGFPDADVPVTTLHALALRSLRAVGALAQYPIDPHVLDQWEIENLFDEEFGRVAGVGSIPRRRAIRVDHEAFWSTGTHETPASQEPPQPPIGEEERARFRAFHGPRTQLYSCVLPGELVQRCVQMLDAGTLDLGEILGINHLIVDEFQDLNPMDLRFVHGLRNAGADVFVAGDDDQSLYAFRYASPAGIQDFVELYPEAGDHVLRHCFRCTPAVLDSATSLIRNFSAGGRIEKELESLYEGSDPPVAGEFRAWSFGEGGLEATAIANSCRNLIEAGLDPNEIMILLSNTRGLWWQLRDALEESEVPFEPPRAEPFKDSDLGRALFTIFRLIEEDPDYVALRTLLKLRSGIGVATAASIADTAVNDHLNYRDLFYEALPAGFSGRTANALNQCRGVCDDLLGWSPEDTLEERADDLDEMLRRILGRDPESDWRDDVADLPDQTTLPEVARYLAAERDDERVSALRAVRARLELTPEEDEQEAQAVRVMTMHGAKGLSAAVVFIPGLEEEILPGPRRARFAGQVLEAARMLYVSITRARLACITSYSGLRFINGVTTPHGPSRYSTHLGVAFQAGADGLSEEDARVLFESMDHL